MEEVRRLTLLPTRLTANIQADKSKTQEKAEYWRAYTKSLLFQNPQTKEGLTQVAQMATELIECLHSVQNEGVFRPGYIGLVEDSIKSSMTLAAEIKCQRGAYELDSSVHLGDPFDETKMVNVIFSDDYEVGTEAIVSGIVSNGWVRKSYAGSTDIEARICKARVVVVYSERP